MTIGKKVIENIVTSVRMLLVEHSVELDKAYLKSEGPLAIAIAIKLKPGDLVAGDIEVSTNLSFVLEKVKTSMSSTINEG